MDLAQIPLTQKKCVVCETGGPAMPADQAQELLKQISGWEIKLDGHLWKSFTQEDYLKTLEFINKVGQLAESEGHHPTIHFTWGKADIELYTHAVKGLSENDFILASKIDLL